MNNELQSEIRTMSTLKSNRQLIVMEVSKYNRKSTDADFDSNLVVEGVVLELQSLSSLLKIF